MVIVIKTSRGTSSSSSTIIQLHQIPFIFYLDLCRLTDGSGFHTLDRLQRSFTSLSIKLQIHVLYIWMWCISQSEFHPLWLSYGVIVCARLQSVHSLVLMMHRRENEGRIIILSLMWLWKLQQKVNSWGICYNLGGFNDGRIIYCYAGGFRCHMFMESRKRIWLYIRGKPLTSIRPPTDQIKGYFSDDWLILNDQDLSLFKYNVTKCMSAMFLWTQ